MIIQSDGKRGWPSSEMQQWPTPYKVHILRTYGQEGLTPNTYQWLQSAVADAQANGEIVDTSMPASEAETRWNASPYVDAWDDTGTATVEKQAAAEKERVRAEALNESQRAQRAAIQNYERMTGQKYNSVVDLSNYSRDKVREIQQSYGLTGTDADGLWGPKSQAAKEAIEGTPTPLPPMPSDSEIATRQAFMESSFRPYVVNRIGAAGLYQVMPDARRDYNRLTGNNVYAPELLLQNTNSDIRDWYMPHLESQEWISAHEQDPIVKRAKALGAYNWGSGNMIRALGKAKENGVDIYHSLDWVTPETLNPETSNYINFIIKGDSVSPAKNMTEYEKAVEENPKVVKRIQARY